MSTNRMRMDAPAEAVFSVLADPHTYRDWVVGCDNIRAAEGEWPAVDSKFHHTVGIGPLTIKDNTEVEEVERPRRLVIRAKTRPLGAQRVKLELEPSGSGTHVTMEEGPAGGPPAKLAGLPFDVLLRGRNSESLRRLKALAESN